MTDYVPYTPDEYAPDAPATALHFQRWFENWIAGFEGAPGAPRLGLGALARIVPGDVIKLRNDAEVISAATLVVLAFPSIQVGTIRATFEHRVPAGSNGTAFVRRLRGGVYTTLATFTNTTTYVSRSVDCPVQPGDQLEIVLNGSGFNMNIRNARFRNDGANLWPGVVSNIEGNTYA